MAQIKEFHIGFSARSESEVRISARSLGIAVPITLFAFQESIRNKVQVPVIDGSHCLSFVHQARSRARNGIMNSTFEGTLSSLARLQR